MISKRVVQSVLVPKKQRTFAVAKSLDGDGNSFRIPSTRPSMDLACFHQQDSAGAEWPSVIRDRRYIQSEGETLCVNGQAMMKREACLCEIYPRKYLGLALGNPLCRHVSMITGRIRF